MRSRDESLFGKIIDFVNEYFEDYGRSPSTREIEQGIGASRPTIQRYLKTMQEQGEIEYDGHRGIITKYMRELMDTNRVQMGNSIPCGPLTEVTDAELEHIRLPLALTGSGDFFLLRASGDSMINADIDSGDLVLIRKQETAREGQIVAFLYRNDCTTLKRYQRFYSFKRIERSVREEIYGLYCSANSRSAMLIIAGGMVYESLFAKDFSNCIAGKASISS